MRIQPTCPRIYLPPGVEAPAHTPHLDRIGLVDGAGPDQAGGQILGGPWHPGESGDWHRMPGGWWVHQPPWLLPQHLVRLDPDRSVVRWRQVVGAEDGHWWRVPVLLTPEDPAAPERGLVTALDRRITPDGLQVAPMLMACQRRLLAIALGVPLACLEDPQADSVDADNHHLIALVGDLLATGQHVHVDEMAAFGWLTESLLIRVVEAACDLDHLDEGAA